MERSHPPVLFRLRMDAAIPRASQRVRSKSTMGIARCARPRSTAMDEFDPTRAIPVDPPAVAGEDPEVWARAMKCGTSCTSPTWSGSLLVLAKHAICDPVNIGYGQIRRIRDVVVIFAQRACRRPRGVRHVEAHRDPGSLVDTSKARRLLGLSRA